MATHQYEMAKAETEQWHSSEHRSTIMQFAREYALRRCDGQPGDKVQIITSDGTLAETVRIS